MTEGKQFRFRVKTMKKRDLEINHAWLELDKGYKQYYVALLAYNSDLEKLNSL